MEGEGLVRDCVFVQMSWPPPSTTRASIMQNEVVEYPRKLEHGVYLLHASRPDRASACCENYGCGVTILLKPVVLAHQYEASC